MIKTEKLTKLFATEEVQTKALNEVTLQVEQRGVCCYNGSFGMRQVNVAEYSGHVGFSHFRLLFLFEGKQVDKMNENQLTALRKDNLGFIFQSFQLD